jgi:hypothetical protein
MGYPRHLWLALLLGVLALMAVTIPHVYVRGKPAEPRDPKVNIHPDSDYRIESVSANRCVQLAGAPSDNSREAQIQTCDRSAAQRFHFDLLQDGFYRIRQASLNGCLEIADGSHDDGAAVKTAVWNGAPHQQWQVLGAGGGTVRLMARHSDKALDVWREGTADGTALKQMQWKGSSNQQFRLTAVDRADR